MDPIGLFLRRVPSGDKTFSGFQKGRLKVGILKVSAPFTIHNKMEVYQMDPVGLCELEKLSGS